MSDDKEKYETFLINLLVRVTVIEKVLLENKIVTEDFLLSEASNLTEQIVKSIKDNLEKQAVNKN